MANNPSKYEFPVEIQAKLHLIAHETGYTYDEVVQELMTSFFELVDNQEKQNVPAFVKKVRASLMKRSKSENN